MKLGDKIKQTYGPGPYVETKKRTLLLCLPGNEFRSDIMLMYFKFLDWCSKNDWDIVLSMKGGSNVSIVRECCLGLNEDDVMTLKQAAPFYGKIPYDYILWLDSDIVFEPWHFTQLVEDDKDIVAGLYKKSPEYYTASEYRPDLITDGRLLAMTDKDLETRSGSLIEAINFGFGFVLIKKGVFEKVPRPWFCTQPYTIMGRETMVGEDTYFCLKAREAGFDLWVDPRVKLIHVKSSGLR